MLAADSGAEPLIILSKSDLLDGERRRRVREEMAALAPGIDVLETSAMDGRGLDELRHKVASHRTLVALGPSGVGKSTLLNALIGEQVLAVADVRSSDRAGRHTTVRRELVLLPTGGVLIDTPGLRAVSLWEADIALDEVFSDIAERAGAAVSGTAPTAASPDAPCRRPSVPVRWTPRGWSATSACGMSWRCSPRRKPNACVYGPVAVVGSSAVAGCGAAPRTAPARRSRSPQLARGSSG